MNILGSRMHVVKYHMFVGSVSPLVTSVGFNEPTDGGFGNNN